MLDFLLKAENNLPQLLNDETIWTIVCDCSIRPVVERLVCPYKAGRIELRRMQPLLEYEKALWHNHQWPLALVVRRGMYMMDFGYGEAPIKASRFILSPGSRYEITDPLVYHATCPLISCAVMYMLVSMEPCVDNISPQAASDTSKSEILSFFREQYPKN